MKRSPLLAFFLLFLTLLPACAGSKPTPTPVPTPAAIAKPVYTVQRGTVTYSLRLQGRIVPARQQDLFFRSEGYVASVNAARGGAVKAGDVLAELELGELEIQLAQAELALREAEAKLAQAQEENLRRLIEARLRLEKANLQAVQAGALGIQPTEAGAEAALAAAEKALKAAERERDQGQAKRELSKEARQLLAKAVLRAQGEVDFARKRLELVRAFPDARRELEGARETLQAALERQRQALQDPALSPKDREAAAQALETAREAYVTGWLDYSELLAGRAGLGYAARMQAKDLAVALLEVEELEAGVDPLLELAVEQARLSLETVRQKIERARLAAPFDGQILALSLTPGSQVSAYQPVISLADPAELEIAVYPSPEELSSLGVDQAAEVYLSARPEQGLPARVRLLPLMSGEAGREGVKEDDSSARLALDDPQIPLTLGETAAVVLELEAHRDVLWLPPAALRTFQGRDFVLVQEGGLQRRVDVRLGLRSEEQVEVLDGLAEGQVVVGP